MDIIKLVAEVRSADGVEGTLSTTVTESEMNAISEKRRWAEMQVICSASNFTPLNSNVLIGFHHDGDPREPVFTEGATLDRSEQHLIYSPPSNREDRYSEFAEEWIGRKMKVKVDEHIRRYQWTEPDEYIDAALKLSPKVQRWEAYQSIPHWRGRVL